MTQKELAKLVGVSRRAVNAIEGNKYPPSLEVAFRIANILCTPLEDVFFCEPDIEGENELPDNVITVPVFNYGA
jgi:DNA-binding XRE family transcriptional regulator